MNGITFEKEFDARYGSAVALTPLVRRIVARNPGPFTFYGTGTYIIGHGKVAVIDPGPDIPEHINNVLAAIKGETLTHILVTHTHRDHSPGAKRLQQATGAQTYAFGPHPRFADKTEVEAGGDTEFHPDIFVEDHAIIEGQGFTVEALHTPGHLSNHLCFSLREEDALFSGDHVMGWSTSVISPPDGDMRDYFASLSKLLPGSEKVYFPTHGGPILEPQKFVAAYIAHRQAREEQILDCIRNDRKTIPEMVAHIYREVPRALHPAAARSVLAHLIHLEQLDRITGEAGKDEQIHYRLR